MGGEGGGRGKAWVLVEMGRYPHFSAEMPVRESVPVFDSLGRRGHPPAPTRPTGMPFGAAAAAAAAPLSDAAQPTSQAMARPQARARVRCPGEGSDGSMGRT
eukprot:scaffold5034_cov385-Prasinococcus_capsulatus_cf.AAC.13